MGVALASSLHLRTLNITAGKRSVFQYRSQTKLKLELKLMYISTSNVAGSSRKPILIVASATNQHHTRLQETENRKYDLLKAIQDAQRGLVTTADQRSCIEEALVCVEGYDAGSTIDMGKLNGTWRLQYTSAPDVLLLLEAATKLPFFQITIKNLYISEVLQSLIAPAILPRSFLSLQLLQSIRAFEAQFPVINTGRQFVGGLYYLSYLDGNMLLGRAVASGGVFVFTRAQTFV